MKPDNLKQPQISEKLNASLWLMMWLSQEITTEALVMDVSSTSI